MLAQLAILVARGSAGCTLGADRYGPGPEAFSKTAKAFVDALPHRSRARRHVWGNDNTHDALNFVAAFVGLPWDPAPPKFVAEFSKDETVGQYEYASRQISIKRGLPDDMERWITIHELLHLCGFADAAIQPDTATIFKDEVPDSTRSPAFDGYHWDAGSLTGQHVRSGADAADEIMVAKVDRNPYLAAATLHNLALVTKRNWCTESMPCGNSRTCAYFDRHLPGWCGADGQPGLPGGHSRLDPSEVGPSGGAGFSAETIVGIVLGSIAGAVLLGFVIHRVTLPTSGQMDPYSAAHLLDTGAL